MTDTSKLFRRVYVSRKDLRPLDEPSSGSSYVSLNCEAAAAFLQSIPPGLQIANGDDEDDEGDEGDESDWGDEGDEGDEGASEPEQPTVNSCEPEQPTVNSSVDTGDKASVAGNTTGVTMLHEDVGPEIIVFSLDTETGKTTDTLVDQASGEKKKQLGRGFCPSVILFEGMCMDALYYRYLGEYPKIDMFHLKINEDIVVHRVQK